MSVELVKCGICGKATVVESGGRNVCPVCMEEERRIYAAVRALLLDYGGSGLTLKDVAEMLHVEERKITHLVNSGYFNLSMRRLWPTDRRNDE